MTIRTHTRRDVILATLGTLFASKAALATSAPQQRRTALVVGNANYDSIPLRNAVNDARAMNQALSALDFQVRFRKNLDWDGFVKALSDFTQQAQDSDVRLFYYAGHGMEIDDRNYLNPIGPMPKNEHELRAKAIEIDAVITQLSHLRTGVSIVIVDACRNNPFLGLVHQTRGSGTHGGLGQVIAPHGIVVVFSTGPEGNAEDGEANGDSGFTRHLVREMAEPGVDIETVFKRTCRAVDNETRNAQQPWLSMNLIGEFCFRARIDGSCG